MNPAPRKVVPKPKGLNCPNCGAAIELRAMGAAASVACGYCATTLDATNSQLQILQRWQSQIKVEPLIPLGRRGNLRGVAWEIIGFQQRGINVEGVDYYWREYVLFNPYKGFRYLSEYNNHWSFVTPMQSLPEPGVRSGRQTMTLAGATYDHFQSARATTWFVIGEFPWQVQVGEVVETADFVSPPFLLSRELTTNEVTWSRGEYIQGAELWAAFQMPGAAPAPIGIFANQPSPYTQAPGRPWKFFFFMAALVVGMMIFFAATARRQQVLSETFIFNPAAAGERSLVTRTFELAGGKRNVEVSIDADVDNSWTFFSMALINEQTGEAFDFGREVSFYHGVDGGESWSEGDRHDDVILPQVPEGRYYLRIEPEGEPPGPAATILTQRPVRYRVTLTRDVPYYFRYILGVFLLLIPLPFLGRKRGSFEKTRWSESDYGVPPGYAVPAASQEDDDE